MADIHQANHLRKEEKVVALKQSLEAHHLLLEQI